MLSDDLRNLRFLFWEDLDRVGEIRLGWDEGRELLRCLDTLSEDAQKLERRAAPPTPKIVEGGNVVAFAPRARRPSARKTQAGKEKR